MNVELDRPLQLALVLLDHQLVDSDGRNCGKVDDIELEESAGGRLVVKALVVGRGAWPGRLPAFLGPLARRLVGTRTSSVPIEAISDLTGSVKLNKPASELALGSGDFKLRRWFEWVPGADPE